MCFPVFWLHSGILVLFGIYMHPSKCCVVKVWWTSLLYRSRIFVSFAIKLSRTYNRQVSGQNLSRLVTKTTKWSVHPAKTQFSLGISFTVRMKKHWVPSYPLSALRRLWSDWVDVQADPSLCWAHMPFCWFCRAAAVLPFAAIHESILRLWEPVNLKASIFGKYPASSSSSRAGIPIERNWSCGAYAWRIKTRCPMALVKNNKTIYK